MLLARLICLAFCCLVSAATSASTDGGVQVYLQPLPQEAARLSFTITSVMAVTGGGTEYPLTLHLQSVGTAEANRQRLLASGRLPVGRYTGFRLTIVRATLRSEGGRVSLVAPDAPSAIDIPFTVASEHIPLVWVTLKYAESVTEGYAFDPVFSSTIPSGRVAGHAGFVTNAGSNTITVFDKSLAQAVAVIDTCAGPSGLALDQRRQRLYVACARDDEVQAVDVAAGEIAQHVRLSPGDEPREVALTPDGATLISVNPGSNSITFFDAPTLTRFERLDVGSGPRSAVVDSTGRRAFVFNTLSSSISVVDIANRSVVTTLSLEAAPLRGQFNPTGTRLFVIHERSPHLTVLDPVQGTVLSRVRLGSAVDAIAIDHARGLLCLGGAAAVVEFYDPNALLPLFSLRTRASLTHLTIDDTDRRLYMASQETRSVIVASLADRKVVSEIDVGDGPYWVAVMGEK